MEELLTQHQDLIKYLLQELKDKTKECNSYKHKLGEIYHILSSDLIEQREGVIKQNESGEC